MLLRSMGICSFICSVHDADADAVADVDDDDMLQHDELSDAANEIDMRWGGCFWCAMIIK